MDLFCPVMEILPLPVLLCVPVPEMLPAREIVLPLSLSVPAVRVRVVATVILLPRVVVPDVLVNVFTLLEVPGVVWSQYSVPSVPAADVVNVDVALPIR